MRTRGAHDERGAVAVEFALVAPLVIMLLLGTITVALAYSQHVALSNAVREGARIGAAADSTDHTKWLDTVQQYTSQAYADPDGFPAASVCASLMKSDGASPTPAITTVISAPSGCGGGPSNPGAAPAGCFVKVWASKQTHLEWILGSADPWQEAGSVAIYDRSKACS
jgi:Flp pilus assembly pilin Flp